MADFDTPAIAGSTLGICTTAQTVRLNAAAFAALTYLNIGRISDYPESGVETNIVTLDTVDTDVSIKAKGVSKAKDWSVTYGRSATDAGQDAIRAAELTKSNYALKMTMPDGTVIYNIGIVTSVSRSGGGPDDPYTETAVIAMNMRDVIVDPV